MTLMEFLLARIAEDEREAERAGSFTPWTETFQRDNYGHLTVQPSRIESECKAKREIVERATGPVAHPGQDIERGWILLILAKPYAQHPDYRDEWAI